MTAMRKTSAFAAILIAALGLAGCETAPPSDKLPEMTFRHLAPIPLLVSDIQVETQATPASDSVAYLFPTPPEQALRAWARDRLVARGSGGTARFVIKRADAIRSPLQTDKGVTGLFKKELSDRYEGHIEAELSVVNAQGTRRAFVEGKADHAATVREDATLAERRRLMYELVERLMADFNTEIERNINTYMRDFKM
jgi:hypothetical protein